MLLNAAAIAALNTWVAPPPMRREMLQVSWIAIADPRLFDGCARQPPQDARSGT